MLRDHNPIILEEFNGWFKRGDEDSCPIDHFPDCDNIQFIESGFETRDGIDPLVGKGHIGRIAKYMMQNGESLLILDIYGDVYHALLDGSDTVYGPILHVNGMTDFGVVSIAGRAYITPFKTEYDLNNTAYQRGLENEFVYVYKGDGSQARKAAGFPPTLVSDTPLIAYNNNLPGGITAGLHVLAIAFSNGSGRSTALGTTVLPIVYAPGDQKIILNNIPIGPLGTTIREIYMTHAIDPSNFNASSLGTFYFVTSVNDNTTKSQIINAADVDMTIPFAAGALPNPTSGGMTIANTTTDGHCDLGLHIIGVVYETDTGYLTSIGPEVLPVQTFINENRAIQVSNIPISPDSFVTKRHLVSTKFITNYNGNDRGYQFFFIPEGTIEDNTTTTLVVNYYDEELLEDASHLIDNFSEIPAGVTLTTYLGRMVLTTTFEDISIAYLSAPGEPEAIDQVDGVIVVRLDGNPLTNAQEFRNILYLFKKTRTIAYIDNGDVPSTWKPLELDEGIGASVHGIGTVLDSGGVNIDYLLIVDFSGIMLFDGAYARPELTWKIQDFWLALDRNNFDYLQLCNDSLNQILYLNYQGKRILYGNYQNGLNSEKIRWAKWLFDIETTSIQLIRTDTLVIGALGES